MSFVLGKGFVDVDLDDTKARKGLDGLKANLGRWAAGAAAAIGAAAVGFTVWAVKSAMAEDRIRRGLAGALKATGGAAGLTMKELEGLANEMQKVTGYGDNMVMSAETLMLTFKEIKGAEFKRAVPLIADLAAAMGTDLHSAAVMVGKALNDPILGITAMGRAGVQFTEEQKKMVKVLWETGQHEKAQILIMDEMAGQFGGVAAAMHTGPSAALKDLTNSVEDAAQAFGRGLFPAVEQVSRALQEAVKEDTFRRMGRDAGWAGQMILDYLNAARKGANNLGNAFLNAAKAAGLVGEGIASWDSAIANAEITLSNSKLFQFWKKFGLNPVTRATLGPMFDVGGGEDAKGRAAVSRAKLMESLDVQRVLANVLATDLSAKMDDVADVMVKALKPPPEDKAADNTKAIVAPLNQIADVFRARFVSPEEVFRTLSTSADKAKAPAERTAKAAEQTAEELRRIGENLKTAAIGFNLKVIADEFLKQNVIPPVLVE